MDYYEKIPILFIAIIVSLILVAMPITRTIVLRIVVKTICVAGKGSEHHD